MCVCVYVLLHRTLGRKHCVWRLQDAIQVYAMFVAFNFNWPTALHDVFASMSLLNFNIELVAPECSVSWTYVG